MESFQAKKATYRTGFFKIAGGITAILLLYVLLITAADMIVYHLPGYFEREYEKYNVLAALPEMTMSSRDGLMKVTEHMMAYLKGEGTEDSLQVMVQMGDKRRGFFSERELAHMKDCRVLFLKAYRLRKIALAAAVILTGLCALICSRPLKAKEKKDCIRRFTSGMLWGGGLFFTVAAALALVFAFDFENAFVRFHLIFFDNDLWLLDPSVDMLVNIVPEGFFYDTALLILGTFLAMTAVLGLAAAAVYKRHLQENDFN